MQSVEVNNHRNRIVGDMMRVLAGRVPEEQRANLPAIAQRLELAVWGWACDESDNRPESPISAFGYYGVFVASDPQYRKAVAVFKKRHGL